MFSSTMFILGRPIFLMMGRDDGEVREMMLGIKASQRDAHSSSKVAMVSPTI